MVTPLQNYANFSGRAPRAEYWWFILFQILLSIVTGIIDAVSGVAIIGTLVSLAFLVPNVAVAVRRLHDIGRSGWWYLLPLGVGFAAVAVLVGLMGITALTAGQWSESRGMVGLLIGSGLAILAAAVLQLVWFCTASQPFTNKWGPNPYGPQDVAQDFA